MRPFFPPRSRALLRAMNKRNLTERAVIWWMAPIGRNAGTGNYPSVKTIEASDVPCRLAPLDLRIPAERMIAEQFGEDAKWSVIFEAGFSVEHTRRLLITGMVKNTPILEHLEILGEIVKESEMHHRVACASLSPQKIQQYYAP